MANPNPTRTPHLTDPNYKGRQDYQGNHEVFEMPEEHKPSAHWLLPALPPIKKVALAVILIGIIVLLVLASISLVQQSSSFH